MCAVTTTGNPGSINIYRVKKKDTGSDTDISLTQRIINTESPMKPKTVAFSHCGRWVAIGYCRRIGRRVGKAHGVIHVYAWDSQHNRMSLCPSSSFRGISSVETMVFASDGTLYCSDQVYDRITFHKVDLSNGKMIRHGVFCHGSDAGLILPHGLALSEDERYLAVTDYGEDKVSIFNLKNNL